MVEILEGLVGGLHRLQVVTQAALRRKSKMRCEVRRYRPELCRELAGGGLQMADKRGEQGQASTI